MTDEIQIHARQIEMIDVGELHPYPTNARVHTEEQIHAMVDVIRNSGFTVPVLIDERNELIAGHGRVIAAQRLEMQQIPAVRVSGLSTAQIKALRLSDNKIQLMAGWDEETLRAELAELRALDFPLELTGFTAADLEHSFTNRSARGDPDHVPMAPVNPVSRPGDLWRLGDHWVICGDCTDPEVVARLLTGREAHMCFTDPPYGRDYKYRNHDDASNDSNAQLVAKAFALAPEGKVWTPGKNNFARDIARFGKTSVATWHKGFAAARNGLGGAATTEPVLVIKARRHKLPNDYLHFPTERTEVEGTNLRDLHPCPKPAALFAHLIECLSNPKEAIYDPFSGSGTTLIACQMQKRRCYAVELDPAYVDVTVRRWSEFTGFEAFLEDGRPWAEVAAERGVQPDPEE